MTAPKPTIVIVHGAYHPPACYNGLRTSLESAGYEVITPRLASIGKDVVGKTVDDDVKIARNTVEQVIGEGKDVVLVGHSYGGFVSMITTKGLELSAKGGKGSIKGVIYLSAVLANEGQSAIEACNKELVTSPVMEEVFDIQMINDQPTAVLKHNETTTRFYFGPVSQSDLEATLALLEPQCPTVLYMPSPFSPSDLSTPQTYVISEQDKIVLASKQEEIAAGAGMEVVRISNSGHAPFLSSPQDVVDAIVKVASS